MGPAPSAWSYDCADELADAGRHGHGQCSQNATRVVARMMSAPPAFAPSAPSRARKPKDAMDTIGMSIVGGDTTTMSNGMAAPTENVVADVRAACTGRAVVISEMPSSSRAMGRERVFRHQLLGDLPCENRFDAPLDVDRRELIKFELDVLRQFLAFPGEFRGLGIRL